MPILIGTASWTDPEFIKAGWYPNEVKRDAAGRLRYYAEHFSLVEVNASFYALPAMGTVEAWVDRTPDNFRFVVKAHQLISGHRSDPARLPTALRDLPCTSDHRGHVVRPSRALRDAVIDHLCEAISPMGHKLSAVLVQLAPTVEFGDAQVREIARIIARFAPLRVAVEFRHRSWVSRQNYDRTRAMLGDLGAAYVCVDAPRIDVSSAMPPLLQITSNDLGYVRLHGRNGATWQGARTVAERFDYIYSPDELAEWAKDVVQMATKVTDVVVVFNNNAGDYALRNATQLSELVGDHLDTGTN